MKSRFDKLTISSLLRYLQNPPTKCVEHAIAFHLHSPIPTKWETRFRSLAHSIKITNRVVPRRRSPVDSFRSFLANDVMPIDEREEISSWNALYAMRSLRHYTQIRSPDVIPKDYAWSNSQIGRESHRFLELYLDNWISDPIGCKAKLFARAGSWMLGQTRRHILKLGPLGALCPLCSETEDSLIHFFFSCSSLIVERNSLTRKLNSALRITRSKIVDQHQYNNCMSQEEKFHVLLGKRIGSPDTERLIDKAIRKFLVSVQEYLHSYNLHPTNIPNNIIQ